MDKPSPVENTEVESFDETRIYPGLIRGDQKIWNEFYEYFRDKLLGYFENNGVYLEQDREDLFNETMSAFFSGLERYDPNRRKLKNWVYGIAKNVMKNHQRKYSAEYAHESSYDESIIHETQSGPEQSSIDSDSTSDPRLSSLSSALAGLSESDRQILKLRSERDPILTTWDDIAEELGIGISAAKMRHKRALERLREAMLDSSL